MISFEKSSRLVLRSFVLPVVALSVWTAQNVKAEIVTIWEDQFTSISPDWYFPEHGGLSLVSQPVPENVVGAEDGFEGKFTSTVGSISDIYIRRTLPADLILPGDRVEYAIRSSGDNFAGDRINLVAPPGEFDFDSGFVSHYSVDGLNYLKEPGNLFDLYDTTLFGGLREEDNLWFGNNGYSGAGVDSIFYVDYIRIVGERAITPGDYNRNGGIDAADYTIWRDTLDQNVDNGTGADGDGNGIIEANDYTIWKNAFSSSGAGSVASIPEPASVAMVLVGLTCAIARLRRRAK